MKRNIGGLLAVIMIVAAMGYGGLLMVSPAGGQAAASPQPAPASPPTGPAQSGIQTLTIIAKGGYSPTSSTLKADAPALLHIITNSTFDCSGSLTIPALGYSTRLPMTGTTEISIPPQPAGTTLTGLCSMGMYSFNILFN